MGIYRMRTEFGHHMKIVLIVIAAIFIVGAFYTFSPAPPNANNPNAQSGQDDVIATVNGTKITRGDFDALFNMQTDRARESGMNSALQFAGLRAQIFGNMVQEVLVVSAAANMGVDVSDRAVDAALDQQIVAYLKQNREVVLGKLPPEKAATDPRNDRDYIDALSKAEMNITMMEDRARQAIPKSQLRAMIAGQGLQQKILAGVRKAGARDVENSYNVYNVRQLIMVQPSGAVSEQARVKADKILKEARSGGDFTKLARENSTPGVKGGAQVAYTWDTRMQFTPVVREAIEKLKPGEVSPVIDAQGALVIVKLESMASKMPANLDQKARLKRAEEINQDRQQAAVMAFQSKMGKPNVQVSDPEFRGYWQLMQAQTSARNPAEMQKALGLAIASFKSAYSSRLNNVYAAAQLGQLYAQLGKTSEAIRVLYPMLEGRTANAEGLDMRLLLAGLLERESKDTKIPADKRKDSLSKAIEQYQIASDVARGNNDVHRQLQAKFKELKRPDLAAAEAVEIAKYAEQEKAMKAAQKSGTRPGTNAPMPAPAPRPGG